MALSYLTSALTQVRGQMTQTKYPEIVFPQFVHVDQNGGVGMTEKIHFGADISGDLDSGLVGDNTTTFDQVSVTFNHARTPIVDWIKTVQYNQIELERAKLFNVAVDTQKIMALNKNAQQTLQKVAFLGHGRDTRLKGLLNASGVEVYSPTVKKAVKTMSFEEAVTFFKEIFLRGMEKTHRIDTPNVFAIDGMDLAHLALLTRDKTDITALEYLTKNLSAAAGKAVSIKALPSNFGTQVTTGKTRAIAYINDPNYVVFDVPMSPSVLGAKEKGLVTYETGLRMAFGGVTFLEPDSALYIDY
ncbi:major capsid family protein [Avibacterium paragallinarum]|uniref:major capsid family protein n=1 Tax=Avibacterium paragallinarum TaxID=728 RepID=UPI00397AFC27